MGFWRPTLIMIVGSRKISICDVLAGIIQVYVNIRYFRLRYVKEAGYLSF